MTSERIGALDALDAFFRVIRTKADSDPQFAADLVSALQIPTRIEVQSAAIGKNLPYLDPVLIAAKGADEFRQVFRPMTDANLKKIILHFNIAPKTLLAKKKGEALVDMLWQGALARRSYASGA